MGLRFNLKRLLARGPEAIRAEGVVIRELPLEELGLTILFVLFAAIWSVFSDSIYSWATQTPQESAAHETMRGINFVLTTGLVLYVVLRRAFRTRRLAEEALRLSQQRFELVALATTDAIWDLNLDTKVVWWSEGMQKLFGYRAEDVSSQFEWWLQRVHPDDRDRVTESIRAVVDGGGRNWTGEYRFRRKDDRYAYVLDRGYIIRDAAGKPVRLVGGISDVSERRMAEQALMKSRQQLRALAARLQAGREAERVAVARDIHDDLGQVLTALKLNLDWLERELGRRPDRRELNPLLEHVVESGEMTEAAMQSVQRIAADLRPALLDDLGLPEALQEEVRRFQERSGITCQLQLPSDPLSLPPETAIVIFRVCQESLTNVARHAQASAVRISLQARDQQILLEVEDNGVGIPPEALSDHGSLGLLGMAERASAIGGRFAVARANPRGTRVTLDVSLAPIAGRAAA